MSHVYAREPDASWEPSHGLAAQPGTIGGTATGDAATYAIGVYASQVLIFIAGLLQKGLLGPRGSGYWTLIVTITAYLSFAGLGVFEGATRQIPIHRGRGDYSGARAVADTAMTFAIAMIGAAGLVLAAVVLGFGGGWEPQIRWGLLVLGAIAFLRAASDCHELVFTATLRSRIVAGTMVVRGALTLVVQTLLVWRFGFYGMLAGAVALLLAVLALWTALGVAGPRTPAFRVGFDRKAFRELLGVGVPIAVYSQLWLLFVGIDTLIVARLIDAVHLGYYSMAVSVTSYLLFLPKSIGMALFPRMQETFGAANELAAVRPYVAEVQRFLSATLVPIFVALAFYFVPVLIREGLPAFSPGVPALQLMVAGSYALALVFMPIELLLTTGYRWTTTGLMGACLVLNAVANYVAIQEFHRGIEGAAVATAISYFVLLVSCTVYALSKVMTRHELRRHLVELLAVLGYVLASLWIIENLGSGGGAAADVGLAFAKFALFLVALAPWLVLEQRRNGFLTRASAASQRFAERLWSSRSD